MGFRSYGVSVDDTNATRHNCDQCYLAGSVIGELGGRLESTRTIDATGVNIGKTSIALGHHAIFRWFSSSVRYQGSPEPSRVMMLVDLSLGRN